MSRFVCRESRTLIVCCAAAAVAAVTVAAPARAQTSWNAYNDFYFSPTAAGWGGATSPSATGAAWGPPWFPNAPGLGDGPGGSHLTNLIWMQSAYLSATLPSPSGEGIASVLTWTAPATQVYDFSGLFVSGNDPTRSAAVAIMEHGGGAGGSPG